MNILKSIGIKLFILTAIAILFLASQFTNPSANENGFPKTTLYSIPDSQFLIGAFENGTALNYIYQGEMKLNTWHKYTGPYDGWPGVTNDNINGTIEQYGPGVNSRITANRNIGMRTLMDRPIIQYLVSGQRIDYQCENISPNFEADHYWFYAYDNSVHGTSNIDDIYDLSRYGADKKVKRCLVTPQSILDGYALINSNLRANRELAFNQTNPWMNDNANLWYIMPRIRIDSTFALGTTNDEVEVCKLKIRGRNKSVVKEIILKVKNFKHDGLTYDGQYKESYYSINQLDFQLSINEINNYFIDPNPFDWDISNTTDVEIYWSGKCDMWIDRVRIENLPARQYLDSNDPLYPTLVAKVNAEIG